MLLTGKKIACFVGLFFCVSSVFSQLRNTLLLQRVAASLDKGINISLYEQYWRPAEELINPSIFQKIRSVKAAGFSSVRLPVNFDHFSGSNGFSTTFLTQLDSLVSLCTQIQLKIIIVYHHGNLQKKNLSTEKPRLITQWLQLMTRYRGLYTESLLFEVYNEPTLDATIWKSAADEIARLLRKADAQRIFIIGGTSYNSIDALDQLGIIGDPLTMYSFHFYEPFFFTHQGASWQKEESQLRNIPYPYDGHTIPDIFNNTRDSWLQATRWKYVQENDYAFLQKRISKVAAFQRRYPGVQVICTETGAIALADMASRCNYLKDVSTLLHRYKIPVIYWDYDDHFALLQKDGKMIPCLPEIMK